MNQELFQKIHEVISSQPGTPNSDKFYMGTWEDDSNSCGTTRCVAGWAVHLTTGTSLYKQADFGHHESVVELADRLGSRTFSDKVVDLEDLGAKLLGLDDKDGSLFYTDEWTALNFVELAAQGRFDEASEVLDR